MPIAVCDISIFFAEVSAGMNKLIVNHLSHIFVTNDAATIMREMEVVHPAAKIIKDASAMQEQEVNQRDPFN